MALATADRHLAEAYLPVGGKVRLDLTCQGFDPRTAALSPATVAPVAAGGRGIIVTTLSDRGCPDRPGDRVLVAAG